MPSLLTLLYETYLTDAEGYVSAEKFSVIFFHDHMIYRKS